LTKQTKEAKCTQASQFSLGGGAAEFEPSKEWEKLHVKMLEMDRELSHGVRRGERLKSEIVEILSENPDDILAQAYNFLQKCMYVCVYGCKQIGCKSLIQAEEAFLRLKKLGKS
jgi:hypothetical protein